MQLLQLTYRESLKITRHLLGAAESPPNTAITSTAKELKRQLGWPTRLVGSSLHQQLSTAAVWSASAAKGD